MLSSCWIGINSRRNAAVCRTPQHNKLSLKQDLGAAGSLKTSGLQALEEKPRARTSRAKRCLCAEETVQRGLLCGAEDSSLRMFHHAHVICQGPARNVLVEGSTQEKTGVV